MNRKLFDILFAVGNYNKYSKVIIIFADSFSFYLLIELYIIGYIHIFNNYSYTDAICYTLIPLITFIIVKIIRKKFKTKRPFEMLDIKSLIKHSNGNSMPSNHSACAMAMAIAIMDLIDGYYILLFIPVIIVGLSRIMEGIHYPLDVLCGIMIGLIVGCLIAFI